MWSISTWIRIQMLSSIRRRTLFFVMLLFTITSLMIMIMGLLFANHEVEELFDARLAQQARLLLVLSENIESLDANIKQASTLIINEANTNTSVGHRYESKIFYQIWKEAELKVASDDIVLSQQTEDLDGFGDAVADHYKWRTFTLNQKVNNVKVIVAERSDVRGEISAQIVFQTLLPEILAWPVLAILVWFAIGFGLEPLQQLAQRIKKITPTKLEPIEMSYVPEELAPVKTALNGLLVEIDVLMEREKRWIADAAHELRTPLSILRVHAQNAETAGNDIERNQSLTQLTVGVDRSTRIVSQLLALARLEHQKNLLSKKVDVLAITRSMIADILPLAWQRNIEIVMDVDDSLSWYYLFEPSHIEILLQNLISNSIKFSPDRSVINVVWEQSLEAIELKVVDNGKGVTEEERQRLSERFFRSGEVEGAGLGLSIVKNIVEKYHGNIFYEDSVIQGLTVRISFPILT
ncbi:ATP-binding protein [Marinomonas transparens]|uniref:histidine kinase n=1 Tax=Marinomonas transparens TaxID=2795388 RepID=A0A934MWF6_9GAMM|nr:ATP-binding protein [Marinomonas transparens]MBJ7538119.1 sensor histidine kinase N-terminal domain-containing protein [Marinomonas transparens]